jgi:hypothetical protein
LANVSATYRFPVAGSAHAAEAVGVEVGDALGEGDAVGVCVGEGLTVGVGAPEGVGVGTPLCVGVGIGIPVTGCAGAAEPPQPARVDARANAKKTACFIDSPSG